LRIIFRRRLLLFAHHARRVVLGLLGSVDGRRARGRAPCGATCRLTGELFRFPRSLLLLGARLRHRVQGNRGCDFEGSLNAHRLRPYPPVRV
jgi:hypothetical protein